MALQELPTGSPTPSSNPWWGTGWFWGEEEQVDFAEITAHEKLKRNEKLVHLFHLFANMMLMIGQVCVYNSRKQSSSCADVFWAHVCPSYQHEG